MTRNATIQSVPIRSPDAGAADHRQAIDALRSRLNAALRGKAEVIEIVLACLLARGHLLVEDRPGLGKTTLAKALAEGVGGRFARVQCTPDLLPGDITGFNVFNQKTREFEFRPGPVFTDVLLADEINRTPPRTQSALLEVMAERQATIDNVRHVLPANFFVIATQNPAESHGTYPLPEAQLDRFAVKVRIGYPDRQHTVEMLAAAVGHCEHRHESTPADLLAGQLDAIHREVECVYVAAAVHHYLVDLATATREHPLVLLGLSPRGLLTWQRVAQAWAWLRGRGYVTPADVQDIARAVLDVRLAIDPDASSDLIGELLASVPVPIYPETLHP